MSRHMKMMLSLLRYILFAQLVAAAVENHYQYPLDVITIDYEQPDTPLGSSQTVNVWFDRTRWLSRANIFRFTDIPASATNCHLQFYVNSVFSETLTAGQ